MGKRTHRQIRKVLLQVLSDGKEHSYGDLERRVNTNWQTIRQHCDDLLLFGAVTISDKGVRMTKEGRTVLSRIK